MSRFSYSAIRGSGERIDGTLRSYDRRDAIGKLMEMGYHPLRVELADEVRSGRAQLSSLYHRYVHRIRVADLAVFTRQMASLLKAGLTVVQTLATLRRQCDHPSLVRVVEELEASISRNAATLAEAMDDHPRVFSPVYRGLIRSGEEGGHLTEVLQELAEHLSRSARLRGQVIGAFIYPIFLLLLGTAAIFVLMAFVIPKFEDLFESFGQELPWPTQVLIAVSGFLASWWWAVLAAILIAVAAGIAVLKRQSYRAWFDQAILRMPVFGSMFLKLEIARIARTLGALLGGGVRILDALRVTGETARNLAVRGTFNQVAAGVATGQTLAEAIDKSGIYPPLVTNLIRTGEDTGELPEMLQELSMIYEDEAERAVNGAVKLLEPVLIVVMGLVIAGIVAAVILPIFRSNAMVS